MSLDEEELANFGRRMRDDIRRVTPEPRLDQRAERKAISSSSASRQRPGSSCDSADELFAELALLSSFDYGRRRREEARRLNVTVAVLDKEVKERRKQRDEKSMPSSWPHWDVEPWPESV